MPVFIMILLGAVAVTVLAGVVLVVLGRGGGLAGVEADRPPLDLPADRPVGTADLHRLTLPLSLLGYHVRAVDDLLTRLSDELGERERRIAELEERLAGASPAAPGVSFAPGGEGDRVHARYEQ
ncbi:hypothetical protein [Nocardiopsis sp. CNT312]|uniref:hypothetical protein n=1 Tax=Nocardiopsis sp. CNT312 TaxID=1137268 RepID=UPI0004B0DFD0